MSDIVGKSFIARIRSITPKLRGPIVFSSRHELGKSGWLLRGAADMAAVPLRFDYVSHTDDRIHYQISAAPAAHDYAGAKLGVSINGYLGFYHVASVEDDWKVELIGDGSIAQGFHFYLRDSHGQRVAVYSREELLGNQSAPNPANLRYFDYLNVWYGQIVQLEAQVLQVL